LWTKADIDSADKPEAGVGFPGVWVDARRSFYEGCEITINDRKEWNFANKMRLSAIHAHSQYKFRPIGQYQASLVERRPNGDERRYDVTMGTDDTLFVEFRTDRALNWTLHRVGFQKRHWSKLRAVWDQLDVFKIQDIILTVPPKAEVFLDALAVKLPDHMLRGRTVQYSQVWQKSVWYKEADFDGDLNGGSGRTATGRDLAKVAAEGLERSLTRIAPVKSRSDWRWCPAWSPCKPEKIAVDIYFCGIWSLLDYHTETSEPLWLMQALAAVRNTPGVCVYKTAVARVALENGWNLVLPSYLWQRFMDLVFQYFLCFYVTPVAHAAATDTPLWPERSVLVFGVLLGIRGCCNILMELGFIATTRRDSRTTLAIAWFSTTTKINVLIEIWSIVWMARLACGYWNRPDENAMKEASLHSYLYDNPLSFSFLVMAKWWQFLLMLLNLETFKDNFLPAYFTLKHPRSIVFLIFTMLTCLGAALAYLTFPIADRSQNDQAFHVFADFFRMFRLTIIGDFNEVDLEGIPQVIKSCNESLLNNSTRRLRAHTSGCATHAATSQPRLENQIRIFTMVMIILFPVTLINLYIGLLSDLYQEHQKKVVQLTGSFRAATIFRLLLHREFWRTRCGLRCCWVGGPKETSRAPGWWIVLPKPVDT
jgi:hypothetical protein